MTGRIRKLLLSCTRWVSREVRQEELNDFRVAVTEGSGEARIRLSGLLDNSALGICAVTVRTPIKTEIVGIFSRLMVAMDFAMASA